MVGPGVLGGNTPASSRFVLALFAVALAWRVLVALLTALPSEDGVSYLWMAERLAAGDVHVALGEVFPPLLPLLIALPVELGLDPFRSGQLVLALAGALSVVALVRLAEVVVPGGGAAAGLLALFAALPVRYGAEIYTEPLFVLLTALALRDGLRGAHLRFGLWAGVAFWARPEAGVLVVALALVRRRALLAFAPFAFCVALLGLARAAAGHGFHPLPKLGFNWARSVAGQDSAGAALQQLAENALRIPWLWIEAFQIAGLLAGLALIRRRAPDAPAPLPRASRALALTLALAVVVVCLFLARRRFLVGWFAAVLPCAVLGLAALPARLRAPVLWLAVATSAVASLRVTDPDRRAERALGQHLAQQLAPGERVFGDMTRVLYYAGQRPLPPRPFTAAELIEAAADPAVRFVVLATHRAHTAPVARALGHEFAPAVLPSGVARGAAQRGMLVLARR